VLSVRPCFHFARTIVSPALDTASEVGKGSQKARPWMILLPLTPRRGPSNGQAGNLVGMDRSGLRQQSVGVMPVDQYFFLAVRARVCVTLSVLRF